MAGTGAAVALATSRLRTEETDCTVAPSVDLTVCGLIRPFRVIMRESCRPTMATKLADLFYAESGFWIRSGGRFLPIKEGHLEDVCRMRDLTVPEKCGLSQFRTLRTRAVLENFVDYAGPLAGHRVGLFQTTDGRKILVTSEPAEVFDPPGKRAPCEFIDRFLGELLGEGEQAATALAWLKCGAESLREGDFKPGQMMVVAGARDSGKSFFHFLVNELFGGRTANPYKWMVERTTFNADIAQAESLVIEDEVGHKDIRSRRAFASMIKQLTVNETFDIHGKGKQAISLPTFRRLTLSVNSNAEDLMVLPPLDDSIEDKVILLKCGKAHLSENRKLNKSRLRRELPAFRRWLADFRIPAKLESRRFGVEAFHHPELLAAVADLAPETALLAFIEDFLPPQSKDEPAIWKGTATQLEAELCRREPSAGRLFYGPSVGGQLLGKLAAKHPERFAKTRSAGRDRWTIKRVD